MRTLSFYSWLVAIRLNLHNGTLKTHNTLNGRTKHIFIAQVHFLFISAYANDDQNNDNVHDLTIYHKNQNQL